MEPGEAWLLDAYFDLSTCRGVDGHIPWRDMVEYADRAELDPDVARSFVKIIRMIDLDRLEKAHSKNSTSHESAVDGSEATGVKRSPLPRASKDEMMAAARQRVARGKQ